jgi:oligopeptidase A
MDALRTGGPRADGGFDPHVALMCGNLTPPAGDQPALLTHREVETIFHEFGHLIHHCLSRVPIRSMAGTHVAWDWVELPSQIMENWCWEKDALDLFARHWQTGQTIPQVLFERMVRARTFRAATAQMRQLGFGIVDLGLHLDYDDQRYREETGGDVLQYAREVMEPYSPVPLPADHAGIASFTHLFASPVAYGAGYYSYKWAEVLDADAFSRFKKEGVCNAQTGAEYRRAILEKGDSADPSDLFRGFMGREPDQRALLVRQGLLVLN